VSWEPNPEGFRADLEAKPDALGSLVAVLRREGSPWRAVPARPSRVVLLGMGSSRFAADVAAARLRSLGLDAVAERASAVAAHPGGPGTLAIAISAGGATRETVAALARHRERGSFAVALTNEPGSPVTEAAHAVVELRAGRERGGVACRTFQHTLALLLDLEAYLAGLPREPVLDRIEAARRSTSELLERRDAWLPQAKELLRPGGFLLAPAERLSSAEQGALMLREGPRLPADACETTDWLHTDVYLTKTIDYRAVLFAGSAADEEAMGWMRARGARVVAVGGALPGAEQTIDHPGAGVPEVALLSEVIVPELVAAERWLEQRGR
jgi:glucosamine--fructose-6-phosphate aminotransferase (isomerizing)